MLRALASALTKGDGNTSLDFTDIRTCRKISVGFAGWDGLWPIRDCGKLVHFRGDRAFSSVVAVGRC